MGTTWPQLHVHLLPPAIQAHPSPSDTLLHLSFDFEDSDHVPFDQTADLPSPTHSSGLDMTPNPSLHAPSTNATQTSNRSAKRNQNSLLRSSWVWEVSSAALSIVCTTAIIVILIKADGVLLTSWPFPISPNSLISTFLTLSKAALMVPVAACTSQLKWTHFRNANRLSDLEVFDEASRGPWGALELIIRLNFKSRALLATWGSLISIVALAMDPFAQQILSFPSLVSSTQGGAYLVYSENFIWPDASSCKSRFMNAIQSSGEFLTLHSDSLLDMGLQRAVMDGLLDSVFTPDFICPTAECRWAHLETIFVCSQCVDVTAQSNETCVCG